METQNIIAEMGNNVVYKEVKLGYRGVRENPIIPVASAIESPSDLRELTFGIEAQDEIKGVFAKNPHSRGEIKAVLFPGHRELYYPHHTDIYFNVLDDWGICPINASEKSSIPYNAPLFNEIVWQRGLYAKVPGDSKQFLQYALGFEGRFNAKRKLVFFMGSYITLSQIEDRTKIDRDFFKDGVNWIKKIAKNCDGYFEVSECQKELEEKLK